MTMHLHVLKGCAPAPLANYLKALGILRLVAQQADAQARGWWDGERFCLLSRLSRDELETFFLERYEPTPMLSPWNKGCGFFKANDPGLCPLENSIAARFKRFRDGIAAGRRLLDEISQADAAIRAIKARTKTTHKGFQTDDQRRLLESDQTYHSTLQQTRDQLQKPDIKTEEHVQLIADIELMESLARNASGPPTKAEAAALKASAGYKQLLAAGDRRFKALKATLIPNCRQSWRGPHADWLSVAVVLDETDNPEWPSLLGTGGNDGNLDFTNNLMQQLGSLFDVSSLDGKPKAVASELLKNTLWNEQANQLTKTAIGQFQPGSAGGANSSTGFDDGNLVNAWDFVLMLEGAIPFNSRATRKFDPIASSQASAPFVTRSHSAGIGTPGHEDAKRGEQWMPLWKQPASFPDLEALLGEARVQLGRRAANRPVDVARAISRLGVARGVDAFERYGYLERNGQNKFAIPLGRVHVRHRPRAYLIDDLASWMDALQRESRDKNCPGRFAQAECRLADSVFAALTHDHTPERWQSILLAAVDIETLQAAGTGIKAGPIPRLAPEWVITVNDNSTEFRLALALGSAAASQARGSRPVDLVRHHVLPLEQDGIRFKTSDKRLAKEPRVVVAGRDALRDMAAIVERRLIEADQKGERRSRLVAAAGCGARLDDLATFLNGEVDYSRLFGLARALMSLDWGRWRPDLLQNTTTTNGPWELLPPETWMALRLCCLPWPLAPGLDIPADLRIPRLLLAGDSVRASEIAWQRLRSSGIRPPFQVGLSDPATARLWAAALVFPIHRDTGLRASTFLSPSMKGPLDA